jgi:single-strand DNA-binding protein
MNETVTTIVGNVISDVRIRRTGEGVKVASFRIASNERRYDKAAEQWVDGDRLYVTVTCWRRLAANVLGSLVKGDPVVVTGRLYTRGYEVEGQKRSVTELEAWAVGPDLSRCSAEVTRARRAASEDAGPERTEGGEVVSVVPAAREPEESAADNPDQIARGPLVAVGGAES